MSNFVWTEERSAAFRDMWDRQGLTARQIADQLGVSRSAICAKARRMGLSERATSGSSAPRPSRQQRPPRPPAAPKAGNVISLPVIARRQAPAAEPVPAPLVEPTPLDVEGGRVTILNLSDKTCKWPIGDPGTEQFRFCGHKPRDGSPYCEYHARLAFQPAQDRRHRSAVR